MTSTSPFSGVSSSSSSTGQQQCAAGPSRSKQTTLFGVPVAASPATKPMDLSRLSSAQQLWGRFYNEWILHASSVPVTEVSAKASTAFQAVKKGFEGKKDTEAVEAWIIAKTADRAAAEKSAKEATQRAFQATTSASSTSSSSTSSSSTTPGNHGTIRTMNAAFL